ncbi:integrating conjugative element protein, PFL_4705 family [Geopseudomonas sagittaria]|uniref:Integrating conjugative element protein, PFL_4705 family n=1 Tax=Geopseudomonas sagittaria TaxID=1135990 RepID=A0A1I5XGW6_9GAMM|nr:TIGR03752 family integrating conjugative element protein [Pseudomonas sagittaria]MCM2329678.1 TIGR03752 family integrating conjugative element protein [Pseudomonas sagittaria]SFQ31218.1 integrating conjugative element protein, PFL_4705 family [Pseudomonas sagittaria]
MNANVLLKWLVPALLLGVALILGRGWMGSPASSPVADQPQQPGLSAAEAQALGIAGDTPNDTVATLVGQVKAMRSELLGMKQANGELQEENNRLRHRENGIDTRIDSALNGLKATASAERQQADEARRKSEEENRQARGLLQQLQAQLEQLGNGPDHDLPIGLGLRPGDGEQLPQSAEPALMWIEPSDRLATGSDVPSASTALPGSFTLGDSGQQQLRSIARSEKPPAPDEMTAAAQPVYTIPENATLLGSVAMSALIGRIPVDGTVNDPYPFKVLVGADNLTANGIELPDVAGAVMSGTATGDWTLSCVRGQIESITFVFHDGTVRTVPPPQAVVSRNQSTPAGETQRIRGGLGYLSDPQGIPCIAGERRSNARQYLGSQSLLTAAGAGVAALFGSDEQQSSGVFSSAGGSLGLSSSSGNSALHSILSSGVSDLREWVNQLYGEAFAAIYVPPAARVALHIDRELTIDYAPTGRRVSHEAQRMHTPDLD